MMRRLLTLLTLCVLLASCKTQQPAVQYVERTEYKDRLVKDTVYERTDNYIFSTGDTVYIDRYSYKYRERLVHDTILVSHVDSIYVEHTEYIEKPLKGWQKGLMTTGLIAVAALVAWVIYKLR